MRCEIRPLRRNGQNIPHSLSKSGHVVWNGGRGFKTKRGKRVTNTDGWVIAVMMCPLPSQHTLRNPGCRFTLSNTLPNDCLPSQWHLWVTLRGPKTDGTQSLPLSRCQRSYPLRGASALSLLGGHDVGMAVRIWFRGLLFLNLGRREEESRRDKH